MITTLFLLLLLGFQLWYLTSKKAGSTVQPSYLQTILRDRRLGRIIGAVLILLATIIFIVRLGIMSGLSAAIVGLMCAGSLVVLLRPFRVISEKAVVVLYVLFLTLEIVI